MNHEAKSALINYRLERAAQALREAEANFGQGYRDLALSRSYYAMFYAASALLLTRNLQTKSHSGLLMLFHREFVNQGIIDRQFAVWLRDLFSQRQLADYEDFYESTQKDAEEAIGHAREFIEMARNMVQKKDKQEQIQ
ncbi:MAG: HEPN domain-containing protein [Candidatus Sumerlaeota bacterium]|nr:HEPN domain-containing protein [Candidatus Sumerlaeota bacterium]